MFIDYPDVVTIDELQNMIRVGRNKAYECLHDGTIKAHKKGRTFIIPKSSVINYMRNIERGNYEKID